MFKDLVIKSRSYRNFDESRIITEDELKELIDIARFMPSSINLQALKFHITYEKDEVEKLVDCVHLAGLLPEYSFPEEGKHPTAFVIIFQDMDISDNEPLFLKDVGIAAQTIMLAAAEKDLGGCIIGSFDSTKIKVLLGHRDSLKAQLVLALGKPNEKVELKEMPSDGKTAYYRDENGVHCVPKRSLDELLV